MSVWVNGIACAMVQASDRGLQYGDGVFETMSVRDGQVPLWNRHLARLLEGCARLKIESPPADLEDEITQAARGVTRGVLKLIVTRGVGGRGYRPAVATPATRILSLHSPPEHPRAHWSEGVRVRVCATRLGINPVLAGVKHLNRLEQVLARSEWEDVGTAEGLMLDVRGNVIEGTMTNLFFIEGGALVTPDLSGAGVAGIMRGLLLERALDWGLQTRVEQVSPARLVQAEEMFLCNGVIGVWPVRDVEGRHYPVGEVARRASEEVRAFCACEW